MVIPPADDQVMIDQRVYRTLVAAISEPGRDRAQLPGDQARLLVDCLVDEHVKFWRAGSEALPQADFCQFDSDPGSQLTEVQTGAPDAPERGATVLIASERTARVRLSGPGIEEPFETTLPISAEALHARNNACVLPFGIELYLVGASHDELIALPRSIRVEVID